MFTYFRAAVLCLVSSLHDGMNLVAKEYLLARDDEEGVLILSMFAGASRELTEALIVNPYDIEPVSYTHLGQSNIPHRPTAVKCGLIVKIYAWGKRLGSRGRRLTGANFRLSRNDPF